MKKLQLLFMLLVCLFLSNSISAAVYTISYNGKDEQSKKDFFTHSGKHNFNPKYTGKYDNTTYTSGLKIEGTTIVQFTINKASTLTIVQSLSSNNTKYIGVQTSEGTEVFRGSEGNRVDDTTNKVGVYTVQLTSAGTYQLKRYSEVGILFLKVEEQDESQVIKPVISVEQGASFGDPSKVTITCGTEGASIYYSINGTATESSTLYKEPFKVETDCTVSCIAVKNGLSNSKEATAEVKINNLRKINYDFSGVTLTKGSAPDNSTATDGATVTLPKYNLYYVEGKTQTAWSRNGEEIDRMSTSFSASADYTLVPVFKDNAFGLGDDQVTVVWSFATEQGACELNIEGKERWYTGIGRQAGGNGYIDVPMHINTTTGAVFAEERGKVNNSGRTTCAQVNRGTIFTIPAMKGMEVEYTMTNGAPTAEDFSFNGEPATSVEGKVVKYTYKGDEETLSIVENTGNFYPSGIKVTYPKVIKPSVNIQRIIAYTWSSDNGTVTEKGGKATMKNAPADADNRVNYANADYYTICLNGKSGNMNDATPSSNSTYIEIAFNTPLVAGDSIYVTAYRNKGDISKKASIYFNYGSATVSDTKEYGDIGAEQSPTKHGYLIPAGAEGSKVLRLSRNDANTSLFIIKFEVVRWQKDMSGEFIEVENGGYDPENGLDPSEELPTGSIESPTRPENGLITFPEDNNENEDAVGAVTGIDSVSSSAKVVAIFTANGKRVNALQKGLNILKLSDGSRIKVIK